MSQPQDPRIVRLLRHQRTEMHDDLNAARASLNRALTRAHALGWSEDFKQALRDAVQVVADVAVPLD